MTSAIKSPPTFRASDSYLRCVKQFALRPVKTKEEYQAAVEVLGHLAMRQDLDEGARDYLSALSQFIGDYERHKCRRATAGMKPLDVLRYLMEENDMSTTDLGYVMGSRGLASEVLNGKRGLSKTIIRRLAERFAVDPGVFLEKE
jgi:HTH-type transcriptional regulator / antitoxin HigA